MSNEELASINSVRSKSASRRDQILRRTLELWVRKSTGRDVRLEKGLKLEEVVDLVTALNRNMKPSGIKRIKHILQFLGEAGVEIDRSWGPHCLLPHTICDFLAAILLHYCVHIPLSFIGGQDTRKLFLNWINGKFDPRLHSENYTSDWRDGTKLGALVNSWSPDLCSDWREWDPENMVGNLTTAMESMEKHFVNVHRLLEPVDMCYPDVNPVCVIVLLTQFINPIRNSTTRDRSKCPLPSTGVPIPPPLSNNRHRKSSPRKLPADPPQIREYAQENKPNMSSRDEPSFPRKDTPLPAPPTTGRQSPGRPPTPVREMTRNNRNAASETPLLKYKEDTLSKLSTIKLSRPMTSNLRSCFGDRASMQCMDKTEPACGHFQLECTCHSVCCHAADPRHSLHAISGSHNDEIGASRSQRHPCCPHTCRIQRSGPDGSQVPHAEPNTDGHMHVSMNDRIQHGPHASCNVPGFHDHTGCNVPGLHDHTGCNVPGLHKSHIRRKFPTSPDRCPSSETPVGFVCRCRPRNREEQRLDVVGLSGDYDVRMCEQESRAQSVGIYDVPKSTRRVYTPDETSNNIRSKSSSQSLLSTKSDKAGLSKNSVFNGNFPEFEVAWKKLEELKTSRLGQLFSDGLHLEGMDGTVMKGSGIDVMKVRCTGKSRVEMRTARVLDLRVRMVDCCLGFLNNAYLSVTLCHDNLVSADQLVVQAGKMYLLMSLMQETVLHHLARFKKNLKRKDLMGLVLQAASGVEYMHEMGYVLQRLTIRTTMINKKNVLKITDFSHTVDEGSEVFAGEDAEKYPWMPPEKYDGNQHLAPSDMWTLAVFMWSVMSLGSEPLQDMSQSHVNYARLSNGQRLPKPAKCLDDDYRLMQDCWRMDPSRRPDITEFIHRLQYLHGSSEYSSGYQYTYNSSTSATELTNRSVPQAEPQYDQTYDSMHTRAWRHGGYNSLNSEDMYIYSDDATSTISEGQPDIEEDPNGSWHSKFVCTDSASRTGNMSGDETCLPPGTCADLYDKTLLYPPANVPPMTSGDPPALPPRNTDRQMMFPARHFEGRYQNRSAKY